MLRIILSLFIFTTFSFAITKAEIISLYKKENYKTICKKTEWTFTKFKDDEIILSIIALSCIKDDKLNAAIRTSRFLGKTKAGRANASYIANLYLIKRLLIQFIYDKTDLSHLSLPKSSHFLSKVFENITNHNYIKENNKFIIHLSNAIYTLKALNSSKNKGIEIIIQKDNQKHKHIFW
jgi:hypothetical protein